METGYRDIKDIKKKRQYYLLVFFLKILASALFVNTSIFWIFLAELVLAIIFIYLFTSLCMRVLKYSGARFVAVIVLLLLPLISLITIMFVDNAILREIKKEDWKISGPEPEMCDLATWSLIFFFFPFVGLPMAIVARNRIDQSNGLLRGRQLAVASIVVNSYCLLILMFAIIGVILKLCGG